MSLKGYIGLYHTMQFFLQKVVGLLCAGVVVLKSDETLCILLL